MNVLQDYSDVSTRHRLQEVANVRPMPWDSRASFWIAYPRGNVYGARAGDSATEALKALA